MKTKKIKKKKMSKSIKVKSIAIKYLKQPTNQIKNYKAFLAYLISNEVDEEPYISEQIND